LGYLQSSSENHHHQISHIDDRKGTAGRDDPWPLSITLSTRVPLQLPWLSVEPRLPLLHSKHLSASDEFLRRNILSRAVRTLADPSQRNYPQTADVPDPIEQALGAQEYCGEGWRIDHDASLRKSMQRRPHRLAICWRMSEVKKQLKGRDCVLDLFAFQLRFSVKKVAEQTLV
jgi:hypothetical protein